MFDKIRAWLKKTSTNSTEKWGHIKTIIIDDISYGPSGEPNRHRGKIYIHLFESNLGNRKIEGASSFQSVNKGDIDNFIQASDIYQTQLVRWVNGRYDPEIPRYDRLSEEDTIFALKGKVE